MFGALADPTRRSILERLSSGPVSVSELAEPFGMSLPGLLKHVWVLEDAALVKTRKDGRTRWCELGPEHLDSALEWMEAHRQRWERRLDRFEAYLKDES